MQTISVMTAMSKRLMRETIFDLAPGECAFVAPSALIMTADRTCHIQTDVSVRHTPDDTASMHVMRTAAGYIADVTYCHYQWIPTDAVDDVAHAPVLHIVFGDEFLQ